jgi:hypothetical protein
MNKTEQPKLTLVTTKNAFVITLIVMVLVVLGVWLWGLGKERTIVENSLLSLTVLSTSFFLFVSIGLYKGIRLRENLGSVTDRFDKKKIIGLREVFTNGANEIPDVGEGIAGIIISIVLWFVISLILGLLLWFFGAVLWFTVLVFIAMLYWVFYRAMKLVFKKSGECKGRIGKSIMYGIQYTVLYTFWIYGIINLVKYIGK